MVECGWDVAEDEGGSSQIKSLSGSEGGGWKGEAAGTGAARIEGGIREAGKVVGISFPASFPCIKYKATAKPSRVRRPSLLRSAKSLCMVVRCHKFWERIGQ